MKLQYFIISPCNPIWVGYSRFNKLFYMNSIKSKSQKKIHGFTLVELIVVIKILAILGSIGFLSIKWYSSNARDSKRTSDIANIAKGMEILLAKGGTLPVPDENSISITASGVIIGYQGYAGNRVLSAVGMDSKSLDSFDGKYYTYSTNFNQNKYQILGLLESGDNINLSYVGIPTTYAGYETRYPFAKWNNLGILVGTGSSQNQPVQELYASWTFTSVDILNTPMSYTAVFSNRTSISGTGSRLTSLKASFTQKNDPMIYDASLVGYWDMETLTSSGKLADLSGNGNFATGSGGIIPGWATGKNGKATDFDGVNDHFVVNHSSILNPGTGNFTISLLAKVNNVTGLETFISKGYNSAITTGNDHYNITKNTNFCSLYFNGNGGPEAHISSVFVPREWFLLTVTYENGQTVKTYKDGNLISTMTLANLNITNAYKLYFWAYSDEGNWANPGSFLNGTMDEIRMYNRALASSEIVALYHATK